MRALYPYPDPSPLFFVSMSPSPFSQRTFTASGRSVLRPLFPCMVQRSSATLSLRSFEHRLRHRAELEEIFNRPRWPTTKEEEAELVEAVRSEIWAGQYGGMLRGSSRQCLHY